MVSSAEDYSFFHTQNWARVLYESYKYKPLYFSVVENGKLVALVPVMQINSLLTGRRGVSLPFSDYCEPIISDGVDFHDLFDFILEYGRRSGWESFEFRGGKRFQQNTTPSTAYYVHVLELGNNESEILANFRSSTRRNIKKATRAGVQIEICRSLEAMKQFYRLQSITRKRHGLPTQPFYFFRKIHEYVISKNHGVIVLASYENDYIASAVYFQTGNQVLYKYGASDKKYQHFRPNNLLMWEAIKWYNQRSFKSFSFGITDIDHDGLRQFKNGMATEEQTLNYYKYDLRKKVFVQDYSKVRNWRVEISKRMPIAFLRFSGSLLYKHYG